MSSTVAQSTVTQSTVAQSTVAQSTQPTTTMNAGYTDNTQYHGVLLGIYSVVLLCGTISLSLMIHIMKSSATSTTSIAVLNLIFTHFIFLLTVPFRIYYYATNTWALSYGWCKMVSGMIHIHMYMSFIFYMIILIARLLAFYKKDARMPTVQRIHALLVSAVVWIIVLVTYPCIIHFNYGDNKMGNHSHVTKCFKFGNRINDYKELNYIISILIIVVAIVLTALQANVLRVLYRKHQKICTSQQDVGAQLKSMCFALIMVVCFIPYHAFRLYYIEHVKECEAVNEVFLSLTTFNCLDMLTFLGRRTFSICSFGRAM